MARGGSKSNYLAEMAAFGWTFASGALGISWGLGQLEATLDIAGQAAIDHLVADRLALLAPEQPRWPMPTGHGNSLMDSSDWLHQFGPPRIFLG